MGTSTAFGGPGSATPLIPSWLEPTTAPEGQNHEGQDGGIPPGGGQPPQEEVAPPNPLRVLELPAIPPPVPGRRFTGARRDFSRFCRSGGNDRAKLGRAISKYVSRSTGGSRQAAMRLGASRRAGARLLGFLADAVARGAANALRALDLGSLAGKPIEEVFLGLADYVCPTGGSVDEGIAREAFFETIAELAQAGILDLDGLTADQMQTVFELFATNAIEGRLCNDIGTNVVTLPANPREAAQVEAQLHDFIRRGVADALTSARAEWGTIPHENVLAFVDAVYEQAFEILRALGEGEANQ